MRNSESDMDGSTFLGKLNGIPCHDRHPDAVRGIQNLSAQ
jgi:hypothetical protein